MLRRFLSFVSVVALGMVCVPKSADAQDLYVGEYFNNRVYKVTPDGNKTLFCSSTGTIRFNGMVFDGDGKLYVAGNQSNNVRRFSQTGDDLGNFAAAGLSSTQDVVFDQSGNLYVSNYGGNNVVRFSPTGASLGVFASVSLATGGMAFDSAGNLYIGSEEGKVYRFTPTGQPLGITGQPVGVFASGFTPGGIAFDAAGNLYASSRTYAHGNPNTILRFSPTGQPLGAAGKPAGVFAGTGLNDPARIAFDLNGNLYVANYANQSSTPQSVRKFAPDGTDLGDFATGFHNPAGLTFRIVPTGTPVTVGGTIVLQSSFNGAQPITFTFRPQMGSVITRTTTLNANGSYSFSDIPANKYTLSIKGAKWLRKNLTIDARAGNISNANAMLLAGDSNDDNFVDIADLLLIIAHYNQTSPAAGYSNAADFNDDGINDITDLLLLVGNYNKQGDP